MTIFILEEWLIGSKDCITIDPHSNSYSSIDIS
jgi:hypothetical protein